MVADKHNDESDGGRHVKRGKSVQMPWSNKGWSTDEYYADRDRDLDKKVEQAGRGVNPYGYYEDRPGLAISPVMHNPYFTYVLAGVNAWLAWFSFDKLAGLLWLAVSVCVFFGLIALIAIVMTSLRVPGWHRARKVAKAYVAEHGGKFPSELKWYT